jgi:hypothetical protein
MKTQLNTFRIGAALSVPVTIAAGTVALAAWLFASDVHTTPVHHRPAQVIVLDDGQVAAHAAGPRVIVLDDALVSGSSAPVGDRG